MDLEEAVSEGVGFSGFSVSLSRAVNGDGGDLVWCAESGSGWRGKLCTGEGVEGRVLELRAIPISFSSEYGSSGRPLDCFRCPRGCFRCGLVSLFNHLCLSLLNRSTCHILRLSITLSASLSLRSFSLSLSFCLASLLSPLRYRSRNGFDPFIPFLLNRAFSAATLARRLASISSADESF